MAHGPNLVGPNYFLDDPWACTIPWDSTVSLGTKMGILLHLLSVLAFSACFGHCPLLALVSNYVMGTLLLATARLSVTEFHSGKQ